MQDDTLPPVDATSNPTELTPELVASTGLNPVVGDTEDTIEQPAKVMRLGAC